MEALWSVVLDSSVISTPCLINRNAYIVTVRKIEGHLGGKIISRVLY